jgi:aminopeptidase N
MTLHQLRSSVGDDTFFQILRGWSETRRHGNGSTDDFRALAETVSGKPLEALFNAWLFTPGKPKLATTTSTQSFAPALPRSWAALTASQQLHRPSQSTR